MGWACFFKPRPSQAKIFSCRVSLELLNFCFMVLQWPQKQCNFTSFTTVVPQYYLQMIFVAVVAPMVVIVNLILPFLNEFAILSFLSYTWFSTMILPRLWKQSTMVVPWYYLQMIWRSTMHGLPPWVKIRETRCNQRSLSSQAGRSSYSLLLHSVWSYQFIPHLCKIIYLDLDIKKFLKNIAIP